MRTCLLVALLMTAVPAAAAKPETKSLPSDAIARGGSQRHVDVGDESSTAANEEFERQAIWFEDWVGVNQYGAVVASWTQPYQGKYKKPLSWSEFYDAVERPDLASTYRTRSTVKASLVLGGLGATLVGTLLPLLWTGGNEEYCGATGSNGSCLYYSYTDKTYPGLVPGLVLGGAGIAAMFTGLFMNAQPVTASEARELADLHNKKLKMDSKPASRPDSFASSNDVNRLPKLALGVAPLKGGGMVSVGFSF